MQPAGSLGNNYSTAKTIIGRRRLNLHSDRHGGHKLHSINENIGRALIDSVELKPLSKLQSMKDFLVKEQQLTVCLTTIACNLDGKLNSVKTK